MEMRLETRKLIVRHFLLCLVLFPSGLMSAANDRPYAPVSIQGATVLTAEEAISLILGNPELVIIDSRMKPEYLKGHIEGAINIVNSAMNLSTLEAVAPDRESALLFYCNGIRCLRSTDSIRRAVEWGYTNIFWLRGGWSEWSDKRLPIVTD